MKSNTGKSAEIWLADLAVIAASKTRACSGWASYHAHTPSGATRSTAARPVWMLWMISPAADQSSRLPNMRTKGRIDCG